MRQFWRLRAEVHLAPRIHHDHRNDRRNDRRCRELLRTASRRPEWTSPRFFQCGIALDGPRRAVDAGGQSRHILTGINSADGMSPLKCITSFRRSISLFPRSISPFPRRRESSPELKPSHQPCAVPVLAQAGTQNNKGTCPKQLPTVAPHSVRKAPQNGLTRRSRVSQKTDTSLGHTSLT